MGEETQQYALKLETRHSTAYIQLAEIPRIRKLEEVDWSMKESGLEVPAVDGNVLRISDQTSITLAEVPKIESVFQRNYTFAATENTDE